MVFAEVLVISLLKALDRQHNKKCPWDPACPYLHKDEILGLHAEKEPTTPEPSTATVNEHDPKEVFAKLPSYYAMMNNTISQQRQRLLTKFRNKPSEDVVPRVSSGVENNEALYREHVCILCSDGSFYLLLTCLFSIATTSI